MKDYSEQVKALLPEVRARRDEIEQARRLPADLARALQETGIFALGAPRAIGAHELPPTDLMRVIETIAAADGSTGWCANIGISANTSAGYMNERGAKEVFGDATAPAACVVAPSGAAVRIEGGVRVSGRWAFASGITHSEWIWLGCLVHENGAPRMTPHGPEIIHVCLRIAEGEIHDTWYVSGLAGTGSNDFSCADVFVPEHLVWSLFDPAGHRPEPLFQYPVAALFVAQLAAVGLGIARAALDDLVELAQQKVPSLSTVVLADKPVAQIELARAEGRLGAARSFLYDTVEDVWQTVCAGRQPSDRQRAMSRISAIHAVEAAASVAKTANVLAGGSAIFLSSPTQRHARDAEVLLHHFTVAMHTWEDAGRVLLGRAPTVPIF